jgi:hypothetical protein
MGGWCSARRLSVCNQSMHLSVPPLLPEPSIYSPLYELSQAKPATWNSPDILMWAEPALEGGLWGILGDQPYLSNPIAWLSNVSSVNAITAVTISWGLLGIGGSLEPLMTLPKPITIPTGRWSASLALPVAAAVQAFRAKYGETGLASLALVSMYVDLSPSYDSNPNDNHGVNNSFIEVFGTGVAPVAAIPLSNYTALPLAFNLEIVGPNTIGATLSAERMVLPANAFSQALLNIPVQSSGSNADITVIANDDNGNFIGGFTAKLYFN